MIVSPRKSQLSVEVIVNRCFGGFSLSQKAEELYYGKMRDHYYPGYMVTQHICHQGGGELFLTALIKTHSDTYKWVLDSNLPYDEANTLFYNNDDVIMFEDIGRSDPLLLETVKELGCEESSGPHAKLEIQNITLDVEVSNTCDGLEEVNVCRTYV